MSDDRSSYCQCFLGFLFLGFLLLACGCASPVSDLWPVPPGEPTHTIIVSIDTWHAMIAFPILRTEDSGLRTPSRTEVKGLRTEVPLRESSGSVLSTQHSVLRAQSSALSPQHSLYEEWGYAEQGWYLEGRQGVTGVVRALFWPTAGVVEVGRQSRVWADRTPQPPSDRFTFHLSREGFQRLRQYLDASIGSPHPVLSVGDTRFFPAARAYHVFHQCHQYTALALREAGLPVSPFWAITRAFFAWQLRRAEAMSTEMEKSS